MNVQALARDVALPLVLRGQVRAIPGVDHQQGGPTSYRVVWFDGLRREIPAGPTFKRPRDAYAVVDFLNGRDAAPRSAGDRQVPGGIEGGQLSEAPMDAGDSRCVGCGGPIPPGSYGNRRTCSTACRVAVSRSRRTASRGPAVHEGATAPVTPSRPPTGEQSSLGLEA
jgi:predicted nucleic acid-binding Zn ribbon protein